MSATDELRRLLDELGIGHYDNDFNIGVGVRYTKWDNGGKREVRYEEWRNGTTRLDAGNVTPAQAIAATVGAEKIDISELWPEWEQVLFANVTDEVAQDNLNECFHELLEKAATVGGTCHLSVQDNLAETDGMGDVWLECDECHWQMPLEPSTPMFKFCPNCGRRVDE